MTFAEYCGVYGDRCDMQASGDRSAMALALRRLHADGELTLASRLRIAAIRGELVLESFEKQILRSVTVPANTPLEGAIVLPGRAVTEYIRSEDSAELAISELDAECVLLAGPNRITLRKYPVDDWPTVSHLDAGARTWDARVLGDLARVLHAAAPDSDSREQLKGVSIGDDWIVATDGQRLAGVQVAGMSDPPIIVPRAAVKLVLSIWGEASCGIALSPDKATFRSDPYRLTTPLLAGPYPNWRAAIPATTGQKYLVAGRSELLTALRRLLPIGSYDQQKIVRMKPESSGTELVLASAAPDLGHQEERIAGEMTVSELAFGIPGLIDLVEALSADQVRFELADQNSAAVTREGPFIGLLMPLRI